jgi:hypothetical protein
VEPGELKLKSKFGSGSACRSVTSSSRNDYFKSSHRKNPGIHTGSLGNAIADHLQHESREGSPHSEASDLDFAHGAVTDIGGSVLSSNVKVELETKFLWKRGEHHQAERTMPASIFHDDFGLQAWKKMTRLPDYYQTKHEIQLLRENGVALVQQLTGIWMLIDLGCG